MCIVRQQGLRLTSFLPHYLSYNGLKIGGTGRVFISLSKIILSNVTVAVISFLSEQFFKYLVAPRGRVGTKKVEDIPCIIVFLFDSSLTSSLSIPLEGRVVPIADSFTCLMGAIHLLSLD